MAKEKKCKTGKEHFWQVVRMEDLSLCPDKLVIVFCGGCNTLKRVRIKTIIEEEEEVGEIKWKK